MRVTLRSDNVSSLHQFNIFNNILYIYTIYILFGPRPPIDVFALLDDETNIGIGGGRRSSASKKRACH